MTRPLLACYLFSLGISIFGIQSLSAQQCSLAPVLEVDTVAVSQQDRDQWHEVTFKQAFSTVPVVILGPASFNGGDPATMIVGEVTKKGFTFQIREWEYLPTGQHAKEDISYLAIEPGTHSVGGQLWEAGVQNFPGPGWKTVNLQTAFAEAPVVLAQPIAEMSVAPRIKEVSPGSFRISLQTEEALPDADACPSTCGWLVISKGEASASGLKSLAVSTGQDVNHQWKVIPFANAQGKRPALFATIQSFFGPDPIALRQRNLTANNVEIKLQEERSADQESGHVKEEVGFLVLSEEEPRDILSSGLEIGEQQARTAWVDVDYAGSHRNPVIIPGLIGFAGPEAAIPRVSQITPDGFKVQVAEWDYLDQKHGLETIPYLVIEEGVYTTGTGIWEAGRRFIDGKKWHKLKFHTDQLGSDPIVMVGQATANEALKVTIRVRNITSTGFEARLFHQESEKETLHGTELIHFLAVDRQAGNIAGIADYRTWEKEDAKRPWKEVTLPVFSAYPFLFGSLQTTNGIDPVGVRTRDHTASAFNLSLQEEQSADDERSHIAEVVAGLAIGQFHEGDSDGDGLTDAEEAYGYEVIYQVEVEVPVLDPVTGEETGETETITQTHMDWVYTDPNSADSDGDGLPDMFELDYGLNPDYGLDGQRDSDGDGISDGDEYIASTHSLSWFPGYVDNSGGGSNSGGGDEGSDDTGGTAGSGGNSGGSYSTLTDEDYWLYAMRLDANDDAIWEIDSDGDGLDNEEEFLLGTHPKRPDTDLDGYSDQEELTAGSDPLNGADYVSHLTAEEDADRDGMLDTWEVEHGLDPQDARDASRDFDYDRLPNILEYHLSTDPVVDWREQPLTGVANWRGPNTQFGEDWGNPAFKTLNDLGQMVSLSNNGSEITLQRWHDGVVSDLGVVANSADYHSVTDFAQNNTGTSAIGLTTAGDFASEVIIHRNSGNIVTLGEGEGWSILSDLFVTDSGYVVGKVRVDSDYKAFRWRSGQMMMVDLTDSSERIRGVSESGKVLLSKSGVVIPEGVEVDPNIDYLAISDYGGIKSQPIQSVGGLSHEHPLSAGFLNDDGDFYYAVLKEIGGSSLSLAGFYNFGRIDDALILLDGSSPVEIESYQSYLDWKSAFELGWDFGSDWAAAEAAASAADPDYEQTWYVFDELESQGFYEGDPFYDGAAEWTQSSDIEEVVFPYYLSVIEDQLETRIDSQSEVEDGIFPTVLRSLITRDVNQYADLVGWSLTSNLLFYSNSDYNPSELQDGLLYQFPRDSYIWEQGQQYFKINDVGHIAAIRYEYWIDDVDGPLDADGNPEWYATGEDGETPVSHIRIPINDTDGNYLPDDWEAYYQVSDPDDDPDSDGITNLEEYALATSPIDADIDLDRRSDGVEISRGTNPNEEDSDSEISEIRLTSPTPGENAIAPATIELAVEISVPENIFEISEVSYLANGVVLGTTDTAPYEIAVSDMEVGDYQLMAEVLFASGVTINSEVINFEVIDGAQGDDGTTTGDDGTTTGDDGTTTGDDGTTTGDDGTTTGDDGTTTGDDGTTTGDDGSGSTGNEDSFQIHLSDLDDWQLIEIGASLGGRSTLLIAPETGIELFSNGWGHQGEWDGLTFFYIPLSSEHDFVLESSSPSLGNPSLVDSTAGLVMRSGLHASSPLVGFSVTASGDLATLYRGAFGAALVETVVAQASDYPYLRLRRDANQLELVGLSSVGEETSFGVFPLSLSAQIFAGVFVSTGEDRRIEGSAQVQEIGISHQLVDYYDGEGNVDNPYDRDSDGDGLADYTESEGDVASWVYTTDAIRDENEVLIGWETIREMGVVETDPFNYDTDFDLLSDANDEEPLNSSNGSTDTDGDGVPFALEAIYNTAFDSIDTDGDGYFDGEEIFFFGSDPADASSLPENSERPDVLDQISEGFSSRNIDDDSLPDDWEEHYFGDVDFQTGENDFDGDSLSNSLEFTLGLDPTKSDTDGDGWADSAEYFRETDPADPNSHPLPIGFDSDADGIDDLWESDWFGSIDSADSTTDTDGDGVLDVLEFTLRLDPTRGDTDGDGWTDQYEITEGKDPTDPIDGNADDDRDSLTASEESEIGTSPLSRDSDGDGQSDGYEHSAGTDPLDASSKVDVGQYLQADSDADGMLDEWEVFHGLNSSDPLDAHLDSDEDGLVNLREHILGTNPFELDSDGDGFPDGIEFSWGGDPSHNDLLGSEDKDGDSLPDFWEDLFGFYPYQDPGEYIDDPDFGVFIGDNAEEWVNIGSHYANGYFDDSLNWVNTGPWLHLPPNYVHYENEEDRVAGIVSQSFHPDDFDGDGLSNLEEYQAKTNPIKVDTDGDGVSDFDELSNSGGSGNPIEIVDPYLGATIDTDGDLIPDLWEEALGMDNVLPADSGDDEEGDLVTNYWEYRYRIDRFKSDTDDDGFDDGFEISNSMNPRVDETSVDSDSDGMPDYWEIQNVLNPEDAIDASSDIDGDGLTNLQEFQYGLNPHNADTDFDQLSDGDELSIFNTNPNEADSDGDTVLDGIEVLVFGSDPLRANLLDGQQPMLRNFVGSVNPDDLATDAYQPVFVWLQYGGDDDDEELEEFEELEECGGVGFGYGEENIDGHCIPICPPGYIYDYLLDDCVLVVGLEEDKDKAKDDIDPKVSAGNLTGNRYRKVALDGSIILDHGPEADRESDVVEEETYIDAFDLSLVHSSSDIYVPLEGSELALQVSRNYTGRRELDPDPGKSLEDQFGSSMWTSNLGVYVVLKMHYSEQVLVNASATATDEAGQVYSFLLRNNEWHYQPSPGASSDRIKNTFNFGLNEVSLSKRFGTSVNYEKLPFTKTFIDGGAYTNTSNAVVFHGEDPDESFTQVTYFRATEVRDRKGNQLNYSYPNENSLTPSRIEDPDRLLHISISQDTNGTVRAVMDPQGNITRYEYGPREGERSSLLGVTRPDGSSVSYEYGNGLSAIVDRFGNRFEFEDGGSIEKIRARSNMGVLRDVQQSLGAPPSISSVRGPGGVATFSRNSSMVFGAYDENGTRSLQFFQSATEVTDRNGNKRYYVFSDPTVYNMERGPGRVERLESDELMLGYKEMRIAFPGLGVEKYEYDPGAGFSPSRITDLSGNTVQYFYEDPGGVDSPGLTSQGLFNFHSQPTMKVSPDGTDIYHYDQDRRMIQRQRGGRLWNYLHDEFGNVIEEEVSGDEGINSRTTHSYLPSGFRSETRVVDFADDNITGDLVTQFVPDPHMRVSAQIVDPDGLAITTQNQYDKNGNLIEKIDPLGFQTVFSYDEFNRLVSTGMPAYSDPDAEATVHTSSVDITRSQSEFGGEAVTEETIHNGIVVKRTIRLHDGEGRLVRGGIDLDLDGDLELGSGDIVSENAYDGLGNLIRSIDQRGTVTELAYDALDRKVSEVVGVGSQDASTTSFSYELPPEGAGFPSDQGQAQSANSGGLDAGFRPVFVTRQVSQDSSISTFHEYDAAYRETASHIDYGDGIASSYKAYDVFGNVVTTTAPSGLVTKFDYDASDRVRETTAGFGLAEAVVTGINYSSTGVAYESIDAFGRLTTREYDSAGRAIRVISPPLRNGVDEIIVDQDGNESRAVTTTEYDASGNITAVTDAQGNRTVSIYDSRNRVVIKTSPEVQLNGQGPLFETHTFSYYDGLGNVVKTIDAAGNVSEMFYDSAGRVVKTAQAGTNIVTGHDASGEAIWQTTDITETENTYDEAGNIITATDPNGNQVTNEYNFRGQLVRTVDAENIVTEFEYDYLGNRTLVRDALGSETRFEYDGLSRNTRIDYPNGVDDVVSRFDASHLLERLDGNGSTLYTYDPFSRLSKVSYDNGETRDYVYDRVGRILSVVESSDPRANVAYEYDTWGRMVSEKSNGAVHQYGYDLVGNRTLMIHGLTGVEVSSTYDSLNRLSILAEQGRTTMYGYGLRGEVTRKAFSNGMIEQSLYDELGRRVTDLAYGPGSQGAVGPEVRRQDYGYDSAGNLVWQKEDIKALSGGSESRVQYTYNQYDSIYRLKAEHIWDDGGLAVTEYDYDAVSNRTAKREDEDGDGTWEKTASYDYEGGWNQLQNFTEVDDQGRELNLVSFTYDANGNRVSRNASTTEYDAGSGQSNVASEIDTYVWDKENRLLQVNDDTHVYHYAYDYRTRRILRDESSGVNGDGEAGEESLVIFSGGTSLQEWSASELGNVLGGGAVGGQSRPSVSFIRGSDWGGGVGGILYSLRTAPGATVESAEYSFYNSRGDVIAKADESGEFTWQGSYEAFGTRTFESGENKDRQRGNTKDEDPTGLLNEHFRYRDLETGTWLSRDPAGFVDGPNLYAYVRQNPWSTFDPFGLNDIPPAMRDAISREAHRQARDAYDDAMKHEPAWAVMGNKILGIEGKFIDALTVHQKQMLTNQVNGQTDPTPSDEQQALAILNAMEGNFQNQSSGETNPEGDSAEDVSDENVPEQPSGPEKGKGVGGGGGDADATEEQREGIENTKKYSDRREAEGRRAVRNQEDGENADTPYDAPLPVVDSDEKSQSRADRANQDREVDNE